MIIESVVIGSTLAGTGALLIDERQLDIYARFKPVPSLVKSAIKSYVDDVLRECFRENKYVQTYRKVREETAKAEAEVKIREEVTRLIAEINAAIGLLETTHYAGCYGSTALNVYCIPTQLSAIRRILRKVFGEWSDKIDGHYCSGNELNVTYRGLKCTVPTNISVTYDINELPDGILKPGCKVIKEVVTTETCRIECSI
jgi:hypothetical protein